MSFDDRRDLRASTICDTGEDCTPTHCAAYAIAFGSVLCSHIDCRERRVCSECAVKVGEDMYCRAHAVCGICVSQINDPDSHYKPLVAIDACTDCGTLVCGEHADKDPELHICVNCASDRRDAAIHQDEIQLEEYRAIEADSFWGR